jgi:hypothetical protein
MDNTPHWLEPVTQHVTSPNQNILLGAPILELQTPLHTDVLAAKNDIDRIAPAGHWDDAKKITNSYEYIFLSLQRRQHRSLSAISPLSRSYYKMIELWVQLGLDDIPQPFQSAHSAEGPGGFLEAIQDRTDHSTRMIAMTLRSTERTIPGWRKSQIFLQRHPQIKIVYGDDGTGNLYNVRNQDAFAAEMPNSALLYTADGGFDFSADFNGQENTVQRLLIAEALAGMQTLAIDPHSTMIIKMFDTKQRATLEFIWLLSNCFDHCGFIKPYTSRPANSERYWVGRGYRGAPDWTIALFRTLTATSTTSGWTQLFAEPPWTPSWLATIQSFQETLEEQQLNKIQLTLNLIRSSTRQQIAELLRENIQNSRRWCIAHGIDINSRYATLSDDEVVSLNLEEALVPFQAVGGRTGSPESSRRSPTRHELSAVPPLRPPTVPAWRSALPRSVLGQEPSQKDAETPSSSVPSPDRSQSPHD